MNQPAAGPAIWSIIVLLIILRSFLISKRPSVTAFIFLLPYIEIHTPALQAIQQTCTISDIFPEHGTKAFWLSSIGLLFAITGFRVATKTLDWRSISQYQIQRTINNVSPQKLQIALGISFVIPIIVDNSISYGSSIEQLQFFSNGIKSAIIFAFTIWHWISKKSVAFFWVFYVIYTLSEFYSYFSNWRTPFIVLLITYTVTIVTINTRILLRTLPAVAAMAFLVLIWQTVKSDYRIFLSAGQRSQTIEVSPTEALSKFWELSNTAIDSKQIKQSSVAESTYRRAGYLEYFSATLKNVPETIPHEDGSLLSQNLSFALVPRLLNPNKGIKNDRAKVEHYTDYYFGANSFASFSLGHYTEAYIDWGPYGMMIQLFIYGVLGGGLARLSIYRYRNMNPIMTWGILWAVMYPFGTFQQDMITVLGRTFWGGFCHLYLFHPIYTWLDNFISTGQNKDNKAIPQS